MTDREREYFNTYVRVRDFGVENAADFPLGSAGDVNFKKFSPEIVKVEDSGALQESNIGKQTTVMKETAAAEILTDMREINRTARALGVDNPSIGTLFQMPHGNNYQKLLAAAMAFHKNSGEFETELISYGLPATFRADLQINIDAFTAAVGDQNEAKDLKTGATGEIGSCMKIMNEALNRLRGIVPNVYRNTPSKLASWASASHVERPPQTPPTPPVNP